MDQIRQAIFNLLGDVEGKEVLDLFSGSGALGIEALSRGALHVTFVDRSAFCIRATEANLSSLGLKAGHRLCPYRVIRCDAVAAIRRFQETGVQFDLVLLDPPYGWNGTIKLLNALGDCAIVAPSGRMVLEHDKRQILPTEIGGKAGRLRKQRTVQYGDTALTFYQRQ